MRFPTEYLSGKRFAILLLVVTALGILAGCTSPVSYPEPLNNADCWVPDDVGGPFPGVVEVEWDPAFVDERELGPLEAGGPGDFFYDEPQEYPEYWEWDGVSETAHHYGYTCKTLAEIYEIVKSIEPEAELLEELEDMSELYVCGTVTTRYRRTCEVPEPPAPCCDLNDGSLNAMHCGRPVALYPGSLAIWGIDPWTGNGEVAFELTDEQIAAAGIPADEPVLIAEGINPYTEAAILVYRLPTGEFQLNTWYVGGKPYIVKWNAGDSVVTALEW